MLACPEKIDNFIATLILSVLTVPDYISFLTSHAEPSNISNVTFIFSTIGLP